MCVCMYVCMCVCVCMYVRVLRCDITSLLITSIRKEHNQCLCRHKKMTTSYMFRTDQDNVVSNVTRYELECKEVESRYASR
jgi:hypothetical protein